MAELAATTTEGTHETLTVLPSTAGTVTLYPTDGEPLDVAPWELENAVSTVTGRLPRPAWPTQINDGSDTSPFDVVCTVKARMDVVDVDSRMSVERMAQQQRCNRAFEAGQSVFDLLVSVRVPNMGGASMEVPGVPGSEVTATSLYWTAHLLRGVHEQMAVVAKPAPASRLVLP